MSKESILAKIKETQESSDEEANLIALKLQEDYVNKMPDDCGMLKLMEGFDFSKSVLIWV